MKKTICLLASLAGFASFACTGFYVGKKCSEDGCVLLGRTVDLGGLHVGHRIVVVPRVENKPGRVYRGVNGFEWTLPATTWKYVTTPRLTWEGAGEFASVAVNEKGLAITATVTGYVRPEIQKAFPAIKTGCAEENLTSVLAASCATAAEAVDLMGEIMAKRGTNERNIVMVADRREAWLVEIYTGRLWAAMRLPEDKVAAFGNNFLLGAYDPASPDWKAAPDILTAPQAKGLAVLTADGKLDLFHTYSGKRHQYANIRNWFAKRMFAPGTEGTYADEAEFPLIYDPARKLGVKDIFAAMRTRYEGTEWCPEETGREDVRVIGTENQASSHVIALRDDLPDERCITVWTCLGPAEHGVYLPLSNAITATDEDFARDQTESREKFLPNLACDAFRRLAALCQTNRRLYGQGVREFWSQREAELLARWPDVFARGDAAEMTSFVLAEQRRALADARQMHDELEWTIAANGLTRRCVKKFGVVTPLPERTPFVPSSLRTAVAWRTFVEYWEKVATNARPSVAFAVDAAVSKEGHDAYAVRERDGKLVFTGSNERSLLYAVYDFFGRKGCKWFWDGDKLPPKGFVGITGTDICEESRFEYRGIRYFAHRGLTRFQCEHWGLEDWKREIDWCVKNRLNVMMLRIGMDDTWQKAFPDIVRYPDPAKPLPEALKGYDNRSLFWSLEERGRLRKALTDYARARGLEVPTDFGTMTHWYSRTPQDYLDKVNPPLLPQATSDYGEKTGLVWDIRDPKWLEEYWRLTDAMLGAGYGGDRLLHTIGFGERRIFKDRAENLKFKIDVNRQLVAKALEKRPDAKVLLAGWDFFYSWEPEEVRELIPHLDPKTTILWDYEADTTSTTRNFTNWGVVGRFPYTFGIFLCYEMALDIRANYPLIESRFASARNDPMCKGVIFWPESSHTDTLLLKYFVENAWRPDGKTIEARLEEFCADRYGKDDAAAMAQCWREVMPASRLLDYWGNAGMCLTADPAGARTMKDVHGKGERTAELASLESAAALYARLAKLGLDDPAVRRDTVDLARTMLDRQLLEAHYRLVTAPANRVKDEADRFVRLWELLADILDRHEDYSLNDSLARLRRLAPVANPDFPQVLIENCANHYCRSHQAELVRHWFLPFAREVARRFKASAADGKPVDGKALQELCEKMRLDLLKTPLESIASREPRTAEALRGTLKTCSAASTSAKTTSAKTPPPEVQEKVRLRACRKAFLAKMAEKGKELGLSSSYFENASGLTKKSRTSAADLLKIGRAALANPVLAVTWAQTNVTVSVAGPNARAEKLKHGYTGLKGYRAFAAKYPFLGGKGGSLGYPDLSTRSHVILTEVEGRKLLIAISGQKCADDPFAVDLAICDKVAAELRGETPAKSSVLEGLDAIGAGYAYATLDGSVSFASALAEKVQVPASTTKIVTALCCLDVVKDIDKTLVIHGTDIKGGSGFACHAGDVMTYRDALLAMMLPSSNTLAEAVASNVGELLLAK